MGIGNSREFFGKGAKKTLVLELSEGEDIFECIKQGMLQNQIEKAKVEAIEGKVKEAGINYFVGSSYKNKELEEAVVEKAGGSYELKGKNRETLFGNLHIVIPIGGKKNTVTLTKAKAAEGLKVFISFIEITE